MGADIWGWVETHESGDARWAATIRIHDLVYRQYGMFASLFGVRNGDEGKATEHGRFRAIAFGRGAPPEASHWYTEERDQWCREEGDAYGRTVGETWVLWSELAAIDWEEEGEYYLGDELPHVVFAEPGPARRRERRGDGLNGGWATLFKLMALLAEQFGTDNVRLSVWFDQW